MTLLLIFLMTGFNIGLLVSLIILEFRRSASSPSKIVSFPKRSSGAAKIIEKTNILDEIDI